MSHASDLVDAYAAHLRLPWRAHLSPAERVWMLVYPPAEERRVRARLPQLEDVTDLAGHAWVEVDVTDAFGGWLARHEYADAFVADPTNLTSSLLDEFADEVASQVRAVLTGPDVNEGTVVAVVGTGALYPFMRASQLVEAVDRDVRGRLLVFFPGRHDGSTHSYRLLDARDGFNYRAIAITATKDHL
ncbi:MAG: DUF1788 domain-containing protein [Cellulomonas sp.]|uniref:BREX protein BrxB domain-containing protein n=1 Tax=Cellulomonas sp. TaxID=40001 RepID=UPI0017FDB7AC|nr:BREX protein BrxB domain-containing protein [Cellulomonas sp.]NMM30394.1 DUF1788 domain-containing protein [Cellulomonas sp.]